MKKTITIMLLIIAFCLTLFAEGGLEQLGFDSSVLEQLTAIMELQQYEHDHYYELAEPQLSLEREYTPLGPEGVSYIEYDLSSTSLQKVEIWYPTGLAEKTYPLVLMVNGSGVPASQYTAVFKHLASWGFIVAGCEDPSMGTGESANQMLFFLLGLNNNPTCPLYGKINIDAIGLCGHSQGGAGVFSALTVNSPSIYKTVVSLSPTYEEMAFLLGWTYRLDLLDVPVLMAAGTEGDFETQLVIPYEQMIAMYDKIPSPKAMMRRTGSEHGDMLFDADAYMTAWFLWQLKGDTVAAEAFIGDEPEILSNSNYQDQRLDL